MYLLCTGIMNRAIVSRILPGHSLATCDRCYYDHRNCLLFDLIFQRLDPIDGLFHRLVIPAFCPPRVAVREFFIRSLLKLASFPPFICSSSLSLSLCYEDLFFVRCLVGTLSCFRRLRPPPCHLRMSGCTVFRLDSFVMIRRIPRCGGVSAAFFKL